MNINRRSSPCLANLKLGLIRCFSVNKSGHQKQNHYDSLGVTPKATQADIKSAYYKLSKECHPDMNEGDATAAEKFRNITAAYEVLGNVKSRKVYDRGLLVGSYSQEDEREREPDVDTYAHAPFYHHRNQPTSRKTAGSTTNYNIDEWTKAHYSKTFEKRFETKTKAYNYKVDNVNTDREIRRLLPSLSFFIILASFVLVYQTDATKRFDNPSNKNDKPD